MKMIELKPIKESTQDFEAIERAIKLLFKKEIYIPLLKEFGEKQNVLKNSVYGLVDAIKNGRIQYDGSGFTGKFNARISREIKELGAKWSRRDSSWKIAKMDLPLEIRIAISLSHAKFQEKLINLDYKLQKILPEEIAGKLKVSELFDTTLWKVERDFQKSVSKITIAPKLTKDQAKKISDEYTLNMNKWINDFLTEEIVKLRGDIQKSAFAGNRYESVVESIKKSYGVSSNKAKFLARQETSLLMAKYTHAKYQSAGIEWYKWGCVTGTPLHPVRPMHKALGDDSKKGRIFRWDDPPVTNEKGDRNNPHEDYNCRCFAIPVVNFNLIRGTKK